MQVGSQITEAKEYIAGLILLGIAPCTAMVFVWSKLTKGDPNYTLVQVSVNDLIMVFAFAPLAALLLGITDIIVPVENINIICNTLCINTLGNGYNYQKIINWNK